MGTEKEQRKVAKMRQGWGWLLMTAMAATRPNRVEFLLLTLGGDNDPREFCHIFLTPFPLGTVF